MLAITRGLLAIGLLYGLLVIPPTAADRAGHEAWPVPVETAIVVVSVLLLPRTLAVITRAFVIAAAALLAALKTADLATLTAFNRPFNPLLDAHLPRDGWNVLSQSMGSGLGALAVLGALAISVVLLALLGDGLGRLRRWPRQMRRALIIVCSAVIASAVLSWLPAASDLPTFADARASAGVVQRIERVAASANDLKAFRRQLAATSGPNQVSHVAAEFERLAGHDVLLVFVESYGRTVFERPLYSDVITPRLAAFEREIRAAGFQARSGWLTSPTFGGQSWLAHGTLLSGLWINNQPRYDALNDSRRVSLNRLFQNAGWRTAAAMPAITRDWADAEWFGYDEIFAADDLGYAGKPFNWVTMPDQYTLAAIKRLILDKPSQRPAMIEAALISSHAPWTPIPPLLDWATIGDGRVFDDYATAGDPPEVVWQDTDRVRIQYRKAIDYSLETLASFIATQADDDLVLIILGDHQPAPLVTGDNATRDVPIHIIAHDPSVLDAIDGWRWSPGMTPGDQTPVWQMDAFYERFIDAFSTGDASAG